MQIGENIRGIKYGYDKRKYRINRSMDISSNNSFPSKLLSRISIYNGNHIFHSFYRDSGDDDASECVSMIEVLTWFGIFFIAIVTMAIVGYFG
jgi:hypothetical protein